MSEPRQKPGRSKQDYGTPPEFIRAFVQTFGSIALDVCASPENAIGPRYYTAEQNGLVQPWAPAGQGFNWCNPPFGTIAPWVNRAWLGWEMHGWKTGVLIPASVDSNWWADFVHEKAQVLFLQGRVKFVGAPHLYPKPLALLLYGHGSPGYQPWKWRTALTLRQSA